MHAVAGHLDDGAAVALDGRARQRVVARERRLHPLGVRFPQARAALDVGEEERRHSRLFDDAPALRVAAFFAAVFAARGSNSNTTLPSFLS